MTSLPIILATLLTAYAFTAAVAEPVYSERYRPQFHFTSTTDWINDPNGLVYYEGEYHLYFQRAPGAIQGAFEKSWGRAFSNDLVHWEQTEADAILPSADGSIWSGSAVVDWKNTSGFGKDGKPPLVAAYTRADEKNTSDQRIAYSNDKGRSWTVYPEPALPHIHGINRDPKLIWHEGTQQWIMALYLDQRHHFALFTSPNLKQWTRLQDITLDFDDECPDFFPLYLDGDKSKEKWVFTAANGHYIVGTFDGKEFIRETDSIDSDRGGSFYAAQTYSDAPDGRRIQIGWLRGDHYEGMPFNQQLAFPCDLTLRSTPRGPRLFKWPVKEIEGLYGESHAEKNVPVKPGGELGGVGSDLLDISIGIDLQTAKSVMLQFRGFPITVFNEGTSAAIVAWDRRVSIPLEHGRLNLRILKDITSIEIFANDGATVLSGCFKPDERERFGLSVAGGNAQLASLEIHELKSAWTTRDHAREKK